MKNLKYLAVPVIVYLIAAFINWNLNAGEWTLSARWFCAWFCCGGIFIHLGYDKSV